ncbi:Uncharacterised protein [Mycobacteroides abscessus subsp. abscessus]|nr:Uncharacterised protein [Mycobacteroides abscessus subsp. abscessus]
MVGSIAPSRTMVRTFCGKYSAYWVPSSVP